MDVSRGERSSANLENVSLSDERKRRVLREENHSRPDVFSRLRFSALIDFFNNAQQNEEEVRFNFGSRRGVARRGPEQQRSESPIRNTAANTEVVGCEGQTSPHISINLQQARFPSIRLPLNRHRASPNPSTCLTATRV
ncbi:unnamed protein product [Pleuronectes platessa]|uniref:Uncharacterized protein n=1 Tax=Pleuronectes platessa TaxID=8262 RepID=A0A9N7VH24_PLEPL|nr:unnamed protein product [Pleuronectes platessa]